MLKNIAPLPDSMLLTSLQKGEFAAFASGGAGEIAFFGKD